MSFVPYIGTMLVSTVLLVPTVYDDAATGLFEAIKISMLLPGSYVTGDTALKVTVIVGGGADVIVSILVAVPLPKLPLSDCTTVMVMVTGAFCDGLGEPTTSV